jgi:hypothetical protein
VDDDEGFVKSSPEAGVTHDEVARSLIDEHHVEPIPVIEALLVDGGHFGRRSQGNGPQHLFQGTAEAARGYGMEPKRALIPTTDPCPDHRIRDGRTSLSMGP